MPAVQPVIWPTVAEGWSPRRIEAKPVDIPPPNETAVEVAALRQRISELEDSIEREVQASADAAYLEGEKAGRHAGKNEIEPVLGRVSLALGEIAAMRSRIRRETEKDLVLLSIAIARRILHRELAVNPEAIQSLVKTTLENLQSRDLCRVRMSPEHERHFRSRPDLLPVGLELVGDATLPLGGLIVETRRGDLDASIESQLGEIERGFVDRLGK